MHNENENASVKQEILNAIASGKTAMRPKWHFILTGGLFITGTLIALAATICIASLIVFSLRETGAWSAPLYGIRGIMPFLRALPATLITLSLVFVVILETLVRRYSFAYRAPLLYSLIVLAGIITAASIVIAPFHRTPFRAARHGHLPIGGQFYRRFGVGRAQNVRHGTIESLTAGGFVLQDIEDATSLVHISPETRMPENTVLNVGGAITVFGTEEDGAIHANGVRIDSF